MGHGGMDMPGMPMPMSCKVSKQRGSWVGCIHSPHRDKLINLASTDSLPRSPSTILIHHDRACFINAPTCPPLYAFADVYALEH